MILWYFYLTPQKMASGTLNTCGTLIDFRFSVLRYFYYLWYCYLILQSMANNLTLQDPHYTRTIGLILCIEIKNQSSNKLNWQVCKLNLARQTQTKHFSANRLELARNTTFSRM